MPSGSQAGKLLRVRGEGVPHSDSPNRRGDLYIKVALTVPDRLPARAKSLIAELAEVIGEETDPEPVALSDME